MTTAFPIKGPIIPIGTTLSWASTVKVLKDAIQTLRSFDQGSAEYDEAFNDVASRMKELGVLGARAGEKPAGKLHDSLQQLVETGPVWDGYAISKSYRDDLIDLGLATRCVVRGQQGYTAATYLGFSLLRAS